MYSRVRCPNVFQKPFYHKKKSTGNGKGWAYAAQWLLRAPACARPGQGLSLSGVSLPGPRATLLLWNSKKANLKKKKNSHSALIFWKITGHYYLHFAVGKIQLQLWSWSMGVSIHCPHLSQERYWTVVKEVKALTPLENVSQWAKDWSSQVSEKEECEAGSDSAAPLGGQDEQVWDCGLS